MIAGRVWEDSLQHDVYIRSGLLRQAACERAVTHITQATCYLS